MARHNDHDEIAKQALGVCEDVRDPDVGPKFLYDSLVAKCRQDPERMIQVLLCLAVWVPFEAAPSTLADRAEAVADARADAARWAI